MRVRLLPYKRGSASARALAQMLGVPRLSLVRTRFRARDYDMIINWGNAALEELPGTWWSGRVNWLNHPAAVNAARNKLTAFLHLSEAGVPTVDWTTDPSVAMGWLQPHPHAYEVGAMARRSLTGQGGSGIVLLYHANEYGVEGDAWPTAPLYTKFFKARHEYRVHVVGNKTHVAKKRRRNGVDPSAVRNHANGYVYCTENVDAPASVTEAAIAAIRAIKVGGAALTFGAVDILCSTKGEARVLEVNTAPGLEGRTLQFYRDALAEEIANAHTNLRRRGQDQVAARR